MLESVKSVFDTFMEYFPPDTDIKAIKHQNLLDYRDDVLLKLPVRRANNPHLKNLPLADLLRDYKGETLSRKTVNLMTAKIGGFFIWCFDHEYIDRNPAGKLQLAAAWHLNPHDGATVPTTCRSWNSGCSVSSASAATGATFSNGSAAPPGILRSALRDRHAQGGRLRARAP